MTNDKADAYQRLRELTRDNVLNELHPALRPDIVAVLDELATLRRLRADAEQSLRAQAQSYRDEIHELRDELDFARSAAASLAAQLGEMTQERDQFAQKVDEIAPDMRRYTEERDIARDRLAKLGSSLDGECPTMPFSSCECCNAAARARELIASNESP